MDCIGNMISIIREETNSLICKEYEKGNSNFIKVIKLPDIDILVCNFLYGTGINKINDSFIEVIKKKLETIDKDINKICDVKFEDGEPCTEQMIYFNMNASFDDEDKLFYVANLICEKIKETEYLFINDFLVDVNNKKILSYK